MAITPPPTPTSPPAETPIRNQRSTFSDRLDAFVTWLVAAIPQLIALALNVYDNAVEAFNNAMNANTAKNDAEAARNGAIAAANVTKWLAGNNYAEGVCTWSPTDYRTYRRKAPGGVSNTDPANDAVGWAVVAVPSGIVTANVQTLTGDLVLTSSSAKLQVLTATGFGRIVKFPAANALIIGEPALSFINEGDYPIGLTNGADQLLGQILPGDKINFALLDNSTVAGTWRADGNLDPWFITAEVGTIAYSGGNQLKISETASWLYYQNGSNYPCVRYISHPADGSLSVGAEYVLDTSSGSVQTNDSFALGAARYVFALSTGKYVLVDFTSAPTLSVGAAVAHGLGGTWAQAYTKALDSQYFIAYSTNQASSRWEAACYDCGASGTTITPGAPAYLTGLSTTGHTLLKTHLVDSTHQGVYGKHSNGTRYSHAAAVVTRTTGTTLTWSANAGAPTSIRSVDGNFYDNAHFVSGNTYFVPYYTDSTPPNYATLIFSTSGASWGAPATSTLPSTSVSSLTITQIGAAAFLAAGALSTPKLEHIAVSGTTCAATLSAAIDASGTSGTVTISVASTMDGKGVVQYTANSKAAKFATFAVSGSTINYGSTKWEHYTGSSNTNVLSAATFGFIKADGTSTVSRFVYATNHQSNADQVTAFASLSIDANGNPTLSPFSRQADHSVNNSIFALSNDRFMLPGTNSAQSVCQNGVYVGGKLKFGRGPFKRPGPQTGSTIANGASMLGTTQFDHRFGRNLSINRYRFAEAYA